jgi:hypothetical protein
MRANVSPAPVTLATRPCRIFTFLSWIVRTHGKLTSPRYFVAIYNWSKVLPGSLQGKERKR